MFLASDMGEAGTLHKCILLYKIFFVYIYIYMYIYICFLITEVGLRIGSDVILLLFLLMSSSRHLRGLALGLRAFAAFVFPRAPWPLGPYQSAQRTHRGLPG